MPEVLEISDDFEMYMNRLLEKIKQKCRSVKLFYIFAAQ